jgi:ribosomal protein L24
MKRIKAGDTIVVISGNEKGKKGKVLSVTGTVTVEGINK